MTSRQDSSWSEGERSSAQLLDLLAAISRSLTRVPDDQAEETVEQVLGMIGESLQVDRITVWRYQPEEGNLDPLSAWRAPGVDQANPTPECFPWVAERLAQHQTVWFSDPEELPPEAAVDRSSFLEQGIQAHYSYPLRVAEESLGILSMSVLRGRHGRSKMPESLFRLIGDLIVGALARSRLFSERLQSDLRYRSFVSNSAEGMWCLEFGDALSLEGAEEEIAAAVYERGHIVEANDAFAQDYGYESAEEMGTWRIKDHFERNSQTMEMLRSAVRTGFRQQDLETVEFDREGNTRIFLNNLDGQIEDGHLLRIWGTARDITDSRQQEDEFQEVKRQLTRAVRVGTMGELSAAITHEIGQPLAAIATNARAAQRFLEGPDPNLGEISEILEDIITDDLRAAAVSQNIRAMVSAQETPRAMVGVGDLVHSVIEILRNDATLRGIELDLDLEEGLPPVWCDGVQVQQVIINLVLNGCEAMEEARSEDRRLVLRAIREGSEDVRVSVRDFGIGFQGRPPDDLFQPFETSKPTGLGMGLSISRTIIESHGGRICGDEHPNGGVTFHFTLPTASPSEESGIESQGDS